MDADVARHELATIRTLMEDAQHLLCSTWTHQLVWGLLSLPALLLTWMALQAGWPAWGLWIWPVFLVAGWALSFFLGYRETRRARVRNLASRAYGSVWVGTAITLTLLATAGLYGGAFPPSALAGLLALVFGLAYFATGAISDLRWLSGVAVGWWLGGVALLLWPGPMALPGLALLVLLFEVVPALVLRRHAQTAGSRAA